MGIPSETVERKLPTFRVSNLTFGRSAGITIRVNGRKHRLRPHPQFPRRSGPDFVGHGYTLTLGACWNDAFVGRDSLATLEHRGRRQCFVFLPSHAMQDLAYILRHERFTKSMRTWCRDVLAGRIPMYAADCS